MINLKVSISKDTYYWLFSTSAQSVSTYVAILLTGYALVYQIMEGVEQKDDSLEEILFYLKGYYYKTIRSLSAIAGLSLILSLLMVFLNETYFPYKFIVVGLTLLLTLLCIILGMLFVNAVINPNKYQKAARKMFVEKNKIPQTNEKVPKEQFLLRFFQLNKMITDILLQHKETMHANANAWNNSAGTMKEMIEILHKNGLINLLQREELRDIVEDRNIIFHGEINKVTLEIVEKAEAGIRIIEKIKESNLSLF